MIGFQAQRNVGLTASRIESVAQALFRAEQDATPGPQTELVPADLTLDELWDRLAAEGITVGRTSVHRYLEALGLTRKKRRSTHRSRSAPTSPRPGRRGGKPSRT